MNAPVHIHDKQARLMHYCGINHGSLTHVYQGLHFRLTDVHGHVMKKMIA